MKATVEITKTFEDGKMFSKEWTHGDFCEFFTEEGKYLDRLSGIVEMRGKSNEGFTITYTVTVTK